MRKIQDELIILRSENDDLNDVIQSLTSENEKMQDSIDALQKELEDIDNTVVESYIQATSEQTSAKPAYEMTSFSMDRNDDIQNITGASREHLLELIEWAIERRYRDYSDDHPVALAVDELMLIEEEYGISATTILSIATWESGLCDSEDWPDEFRNANNACGIMSSEGAKEFESVSECFRYTAELLRYSYIDKGYDTLYEIGPIYCDDAWGGKVSGTLELYNDKLHDIMN